MPDTPTHHAESRRNSINDSNTFSVAKRSSCNAMEEWEKFYYFNLRRDEKEKLFFSQDV